jgi:hypothetical protein
MPGYTIPKTDTCARASIASESDNASAFDNFSRSAVRRAISALAAASIRAFALAASTAAFAFVSLAFFSASFTCKKKMTRPDGWETVNGGRRHAELQRNLIPRGCCQL